MIHEVLGGNDLNGEQKLKDYAASCLAKKVYVIDNDIIHFANFGSSSCTAVIGEHSVILIDAVRSSVYARQVREILSEYTDKPVRTIIYTTILPETQGGSGVFADTVEQVIGCTETVRPRIARTCLNDVKEMRKIFTRGYGLSDKLIIPDGNTRQEVITSFDSTRDSWLEPTLWIENNCSMEIDGVRLSLLRTPGETPETITVWLPEKKAAAVGSLFYGTFPNFNIVTGSDYMETEIWCDSLRKVRDLEPEILLPAMTVPVTGRENVRTVLTTFADALEYILIETLTGINDGLGLDEIIASVSLPEQYQTWYLEERFGRVEWMIRAIWARNMGWFSGLAAELTPLPADTFHEELIQLIGYEKLSQRIGRALSDGEYQLALQLCELDSRRYRVQKKQALKALGRESDCLGERYFLLARAEEL